MRRPQCRTPARTMDRATSLAAPRWAIEAERTTVRSLPVAGMVLVRRKGQADTRLAKPAPVAATGHSRARSRWAERTIRAEIAARISTRAGAGETTGLRMAGTIFPHLPAAAVRRSI